MKRVVSADEMRQFERERFEAGLASGLDWMERAAQGVFRQALRRYGKARYLVLCGGGNNGGDGFAVSRMLHEAGCGVTVCLMREPDSLFGDARANHARASRLKIPMEQGLTDAALEDCDVVVDALFGTGLSRAVTGADAEAIERVNASGKPVLAVDMPSGADATTGTVLGAAIRADCTVTFQFIKTGQLFYPARALCGALVVSPLCEDEETDARMGLIERSDVERRLPERAADAHKGKSGRLLLCVGSEAYTGAALLSAGAALRAGAGITSVATLACVKRAFSVLPEVCACAVGEGDEWGTAACQNVIHMLEQHTAYGIGCGVGRGDITPVIHAVLQTKKPVVLDADALNQMNEALKALLHPNAALTPHPGEMARLTGLSIDEITREPIRVARTYAKEWNCVVLLKGATSVVSDGENTRLNTTGNAGLAKGGSGDVLTGIVAALLAQGLSAFDAACAGAYLLGASAQEALALLTTRALTAGDVIDAIQATVDRRG